MIEVVLLEAVGNLLKSALREWWEQRRTSGRFDFLLQNEQGRTVALELKGRRPDAAALATLSDALASESGLDEFFLVTPDAPTAEDLQRFDAILSDTPTKHRWIAINDLPSVLGVKSPGDLTSPATLSRLQTDSLITAVQRYANAPIGPGEAPRSTPDERVALPPEIFPLRRQVPYAVLAKIATSGNSVEQELRFGARSENVTIVLSDIKNFSSLVHASRPDELTTLMNRYYLGARDLVWKSGGLLDKFIGDAVLAVFGFPYPSPEAAVNAIKFARELTRLGQEITTAWQSELSVAVETGTRIGIATGDVWTVNIGRNEPELSFLGDVINLAARLEKNCIADGVLLENRTRTKAVDADSLYVSTLNLQEKVILPDDAKGQTLAIRAWQVPPH